MPNAILSKFATRATLTISLNSLATSTAGVGRQSTLVDNSATRYSRIILSASIKLGTSPTGNRAVYVYLIRGNGTERADGAGPTDAGITVVNAELLGVMASKSSPATGDVLVGAFLIEEPGPEWGIAIVHDTGVNLDSTGGNHVLSYVGVNPEVQ